MGDRCDRCARCACEWISWWDTCNECWTWRDKTHSMNVSYRCRWVTGVTHSLNVSRQEMDNFFGLFFFLWHGWHGWQVWQVWQVCLWMNFLITHIQWMLDMTWWETFNECVSWRNGQFFWNFFFLWHVWHGWQVCLWMNFLIRHVQWMLDMTWWAHWMNVFHKIYLIRCV